MSRYRVRGPRKIRDDMDQLPSTFEWIIEFEADCASTCFKEHFGTPIVEFIKPFPTDWYQCLHVSVAAYNDFQQWKHSVVAE